MTTNPPRTRSSRLRRPLVPGRRAYQTYWTAASWDLYSRLQHSMCNLVSNVVYEQAKYETYEVCEVDVSFRV